MSILGQQGHWMWSRDLDGSVGHSITIQVSNRDVFAEIALFDVWVTDEEFHSSICGISQIVSDNGVENFNIEDLRPMAFRRNVTSITFRTEAINSQVSARWMLYFWS